MSKIINPQEDTFDFLNKSVGNKKKKIVTGIIIQARMTSQRFPGKSMALLNKRPVIEHCIIRCKKSNLATKVILAVPDTPESEPMLELADRENIMNFCGDEKNVLDRFYKAAIYHHLDIIVRITGDCPFINPIIIDETIELLQWRKLDYASNVHPKRTYPKGCDVEVFTMDLLEAANLLAITDYDKEHVTPWMQNHPDIKKGNVCQKQNQSEINLCVDFPEDIARLEKIISDRKKKMI